MPIEWNITDDAVKTYVERHAPGLAFEEAKDRLAEAVKLAVKIKFGELRGYDRYKLPTIDVVALVRRGGVRTVVTILPKIATDAEVNEQLSKLSKEALLDHEEGLPPFPHPVAWRKRVYYAEDADYLLALNTWKEVEREERIKWESHMTNYVSRKRKEMLAWEEAALEREKRKEKHYASLRNQIIDQIARATMALKRDRGRLRQENEKLRAELKRLKERDGRRDSEGG